MNCSTPGLPVHHKFPEFTQTHAHRVGVAIQPSHPLSYRLIIFLLDRVEKAWTGVTVFSPTLPSLAGWPLGNHSTSSLVTKSVWDPAAHLSKANKQAKLMEGKVCFILDASNWGLGGYMQKQHSTFLTVIFKLVISGLTNIILVVLGTVILQGPFVPISLWLILRIVAALVLRTVWSSCS